MRTRERLLDVTAVRSGTLRVAAFALAFLVPVLGKAQNALERGELARREARIDDAAAAYLEALRSGSLDASEVAHVHLRLAEIAFLGEELEDGLRHLRFALALRPDAPVDDGPLTMQDSAAAILVERAQRRVRALIEVGDASAPIHIDIRDAPEGLVRVVEVRGAGGYSRTVAWDGSPRALDVPVQARPIAIRALDAHGNELARAGDRGVPDVRPSPVAGELAPIGPPEPPDAAEERDDFFESPWPWLVAGAIVVGVAIAVGASASGERYVVGAPRAP